MEILKGGKGDEKSGIIDIVVDGNGEFDQLCGSDKDD